VQIDLNNVKMVIFISVTKNAPDVPPCSCRKRWIAERWEKVVWNISINLYCIDFFYCNKNLQKISKNFRTDL